MVMKYTVYRTVNLFNGKFYFGVHKTVNPDDEYLGSGTYIKRAVAKYGEQNFRKEVLFVYLDAESAFGKEDELIQCWRHHPLCKNLRKGGSGGFDYINRKGRNTVGVVRGGEAWKARVDSDPTLKTSIVSRMNSAKRGNANAIRQSREAQVKACKAAALKASKPEARNRAIELFKNGMSRTKIAKQLKVSKGSVSSWVKAHDSRLRNLGCVFSR